MNEQITTMRRPRVVAHRGANDVAPENTLAAVRAAVMIGVDAVEVDVQSTRDGVPVVLHDATLARTTDIARRFPHRADDPVSTFTYAEIRQLDAGSWRGDTFAGEPVPTLEQVLDALRATGVGLLLEIKHPETQPDLVPAVADVLSCFSPGVAVTVQSFDAASLRTFGRLLPEVPRGLLVHHAPRQPVLEAWASAVNPWYGTVSSSYVRRAQLAGLETYVWTANARAAILRAADAGVEGIITDRPQRALDLLRSTSRKTSVR
ncbi:glycerophosphodiester phosphodiesterase [Mumia sp. Pv 4-285]|uniref:glycerophosphodiester phosphodiesterase n=1 Tax=Mumia qirimensis TaxID=3234852 RepID=UPI00351D3B4B